MSRKRSEKLSMGGARRRGVALLALCLAGAAQAAVQYVQIDPVLPHGSIADVGGVPVLPFDVGPQAAIANWAVGVTTIPGVPSPATGSLTVAPGVQKQTMPGTWTSIWANGYTGPIFFTQGAQTITLTLPPRTTAFYVFAEQNVYGTFDITATTDSGATSGAVTVVGVATPPAVNSIPGIGFLTTTPGEAIQTITIDVEAGSNGFAIALFAMAQAPAAPTPGAAAPAAGSAVLNFTAPADTGTHPITGYAASCTPQGGGATIMATGAASPVTVPGLAGGTAYDCTLAATSLAGTGPAAASVAVTPLAAAPAGAVTPVPTLGTWGLGLLGALLGFFGMARQRKTARL